MRNFKTLSRYVFATFFVSAGLMHFRIPDFYLRIMPDYFPAEWHKPLVDISGVAEIVLGAMLMFSDLQRIAGWGLILLLIAVFPANVYVYQHQELFPVRPIWHLQPGMLHLLRLPLQGLLILWAFWYTLPDRRSGALGEAAPVPEVEDSGGPQSGAAT